MIRHPLGDGRHLARIGFQAPELWDNKPLNVTLVLDASGSMADGNRVDIAVKPPKASGGASETRTVSRSFTSRTWLSTS